MTTQKNSIIQKVFVAISGLVFSPHIYQVKVIVGQYADRVSTLFDGSDGGGD